MDTYYVGEGPVRGRCPHRHRTIGAAVRCCREDQKGCKRQGGYSDRDVRAVEDGYLRGLTDEEFEELCAHAYGRER